VTEEKAIKVRHQTADDLPHERSPRDKDKPPRAKHVNIHHKSVVSESEPLDEPLPEDEEEVEPEPPDEVVIDPTTSDSGGATYRPITRLQDPASDPMEPWTGAGPNDTPSRGYTHGWNNCLMTVGGVALDYHTGGARRHWGGTMRHNQTDQVGGTDILDLKTAWAKLGFTLINRTGQGWAGVAHALDAELRAVCLQGVGNCPGSGTYTGAHAILLLPERRHDSAGNLERLMMDPLVKGYQWADNAVIREWAQRLNSNIQFAVTRSRV
jgi:hypothetical protein